jgi:hypothetical protein
MGVDWKKVKMIFDLRQNYNYLASKHKKIQVKITNIRNLFWDRENFPKFWCVLSSDKDFLAHSDPFVLEYPKLQNCSLAA